MSYLVTESLIINNYTEVCSLDKNSMVIGHYSEDLRQLKKAVISGELHQAMLTVAMAAAFIFDSTLK